MIRTLINKRSQSPDFPYYVKAMAMGLPAMLFGLQLSGWIFILPAILNGHSDFRQLYTAGYMLEAGQRHSLYDYDAQIAFQSALVGPEQIALPFNHLAYEALVFAPLSRLSYRLAFFVFLSINLLLLWLSYRLLRPQLDGLRLIYKWLPAVMLISFLPVAATLMQGQDSMVLLALLAGMNYCLVGGNDLRAGLLLGLGCFKFQVVVPIALLFLLCRRWRMSTGFAISAALVTTGSLWLVGFSQFAHYSRSLLSMSTHSTVIDQLKYGINPIEMPNLRGLVYAVLNSHVSRFWIQVTIFVVSSVLFLAVAVRLRASDGKSDIVSTAVATATALSYHLYIHDLTVLALPILLTSSGVVDAESSMPSAKRLVLRVSVAMFIAPAIMSFMPYCFYLLCVLLLAFIWVLAFLKPSVQLNACHQID